MEITIPYNFTPREYQLPLWRAFDTGIKRMYTLWHRRAGKDLCLWNMMIKGAVQKRGLYYYFLPTYAQGKKVIWDGMTNDGRRFLDYIPKEIIQSQDAQEMKVVLKTGSIIQVIGTDNYDSVRGTNPLGAVFSEDAYHSPAVWDVISPIFELNGGWAVFNTTPNGKNHSYKRWALAQNNPAWFTQKLTVEDTGLLKPEDIENMRREGRTEDYIQQEYYCSFDVGALGTFYSAQVSAAQERIKPFEAEDSPVDLFLDLGKNDSTSIVFVQFVGREVRVVDYLEDANKEIAFYADEIKKKGYRYGTMYLPHDGFAKRLESSTTIAEQFESHGFSVQQVPGVGFQNGIQAVRRMFPRVWFNRTTTERLVEHLEGYRREFDVEKKVFRSSPVHDEHSHGADAFRYLAVIAEEVQPTNLAEHQKAQQEYLQGVMEIQFDIPMSTEDKDAWRARDPEGFKAQTAYLEYLKTH